MAYADQAALANDAPFQAKVRVAIMTAATQIMGEAQGGMSSQKHGKRQSLAVAVLSTGGSSQLERFTWAVITNAAITSASTDNDIQFQVNSVWDDLAGVIGGE